MPDRPIIFSAPMVRALLDGRKTQHRVVLKHKVIDLSIAPRVEVDHPSWIQFIHPQGGPLTCVKWPCAPGDRLWVREAWRSASCYDDLAPSAMGGEEPVRYEANASWQTWGWGAPLRSHGRLRQGIHMPRWASRLTLAVTEVRVQRLQDISEEDALAEGIEMVGLSGHAGAEWRNYGGGSPFVDSITTKTRESFATLWNSLHGPDAWDANPWVGAITFTVERRNIDGGAA